LKGREGARVEVRGGGPARLSARFKKPREGRSEKPPSERRPPEGQWGGKSLEKRREFELEQVPFTSENSFGFAGRIGGGGGALRSWQTRGGGAREG